jgi:hypothetical protein
MASMTMTARIACNITSYALYSERVVLIVKERREERKEWIEFSGNVQTRVKLATRFVLWHHRRNNNKPRDTREDKKMQDCDIAG